MCQGSPSAVALALVQLAVSTSALVTAPTRVPLVLAMVALWKEPSRVTLHLTVTAGLLNSSLDQVTLMFWLLTERFLAEAVLIAAESSRAAMSAVRPSFADMRI